MPQVRRARVQSSVAPSGAPQLYSRPSAAGLASQLTFHALGAAGPSRAFAPSVAQAAGGSVALPGAAASNPAGPASSSVQASARPARMRPGASAVHALHPTAAPLIYAPYAMYPTGGVGTSSSAAAPKALPNPREQFTVHFCTDYVKRSHDVCNVARTASAPLVVEI